MKKLLITGILAASFIVPAVASADVPRCQVPLTSTTTAQFTATTPYGQVGQWQHVWTRDYTVTVNANGTFTGTGKVYRDGGAFFANETINGTFNADKTISFTAGYTNVAGESDFSYTLTNAPTDGTTATTPSETDPLINFNMDTKVSTPTMQEITTSTTDQNHGQYVSAQGGGKDAAHACVGMPLNSNKIK
jgi:hypothetical protein